MSESSTRLTAKTMSILERIASGHNYDQILSTFPEFTYLDIFRAADEALTLSVSAQAWPSKHYTLEEKRERHPRAYVAWTDEEDRRLETLIAAGTTVARIAGELQRNRGAIRSRLVKLNLVERLTPHEQVRFEHATDVDDDAFS